MTLDVSTIIEILGTISFTISGVFSAMQKRLDIMGVIIIGFVTAIGGGTVRDVLIGNTPVSWMRNIDIPLIILVTAICTIIFKHYIKTFKVTLFLFDALGLGLFTIIGVQKGLSAGLHPAICVALGTITGCFGGVIRDILLNTIPLIFHKEIYASACIIGGSLYLLMLHVIDPALAKLMAVAVVCGIRIVAVRFGLKLPVS
ncbi:trimeric intracellular cation channel family protein [Mucilaginibacter jinjuensis]|uniref:Trimeric intracellular cation channel family protein n=1 Tax=Mucilaginibacter jinjuensis TaxID=1176721 RepID=A0ABY7TBJ1_9SPHI|nr:trimeric intracellular cation channel family protein [Mucilaginibacter jinjuensis]WCT13088.1 trimeric intracellular cation channel family protein [Mucilaginibacter jinjuensis]